MNLVSNTIISSDAEQFYHIQLYNQGNTKHAMVKNQFNTVTCMGGYGIFIVRYWRYKQIPPKYETPKYSSNSVHNKQDMAVVSQWTF